jgi:uncharacterized protein (TIGR02118 family)
VKKLIALYKRPKDIEAFLEHYRSVHTPLVLNTPGLAALVVNRVEGSPFGGEPPYFMIAEMHFPDLATFNIAMQSPENRAAGKDLMSFARDLVTLLIVDDTRG